MGHYQADERVQYESQERQERGGRKILKEICSQSYQIFTRKINLNIQEA